MISQKKVKKHYILNEQLFYQTSQIRSYKILGKKDKWKKDNGKKDKVKKTKEKRQ